MVQVRAFVVVEISRIRRPAIQMAGQLQHVVAGAGFAGLLGDVVGDAVGRKEVFAVAVAADDVAVVLGDARQKNAAASASLRRPSVRAGARGRSVWDLRVGMQVGQFIAALRQRQQDLV
jgi:hypothetical protein